MSNRIHATTTDDHYLMACTEIHRNAKVIKFERGKIIVDTCYVLQTRNDEPTCHDKEIWRGDSRYVIKEPFLYNMIIS